MSTGNEKYVIDKINSMSINEARQAIASGQFGSIGRPDREFASTLLASKEAALRDKREVLDLSISSKALQASERANKLASEANALALKAQSDARAANTIAIIAAIIAIIAVIVPIAIALLTKN